MNTAERTTVDSGMDEFGGLWRALCDVLDPEVPVLSVVDLGVVRAIRRRGEIIEIDVAPTYSGCPAMEVIEQRIAVASRRQTGREVCVNRVLSPPWTTDWISREGKEKLRKYGIAPPALRAARSQQPVACPRCGSVETQCVSEFGSTACKAAYRCNSCLEPFEHFKCL